MNEARKILDIKNLTVSFRTENGPMRVIRGVNFDLKKGETLAIVGESGSGKSVTVKTIIIKDHLQKRQGIPSKSRLPSYLDKVLKKRILSFLTESGWISRDAS